MTRNKTEANLMRQKTDPISELSRLNRQLTRLIRSRLRALDRAHYLYGLADAIDRDFQFVRAARDRLERRLGIGERSAS